MARWLGGVTMRGDGARAGARVSDAAGGDLETGFSGSEDSPDKRDVKETELAEVDTAEADENMDE